jgi:hypothetical protein
MELCPIWPASSSTISNSGALRGGAGVDEGWQVRGGGWPRGGWGGARARSKQSCSASGAADSSLAQQPEPAAHMPAAVVRSPSAGSASASLSAGRSAGLSVVA